MAEPPQLSPHPTLDAIDGIPAAPPGIPHRDRTDIGTNDLSLPQTWAAAATFTAIAASTIALPVLGCLVAGPRLEEPLDKLKIWMEDNHGGLIGAILIIIGLALLYKGIHALA